jgi:cytochrome c-type biogenesis protein CcmH
MISDTEAAGARLEIQRRLLATDTALKSGVGNGRGPAPVSGADPVTSGARVANGDAIVSADTVAGTVPAASGDRSADGDAIARAAPATGDDPVASPETAVATDTGRIAGADTGAGSNPADAPKPQPVRVGAETTDGPRSLVLAVTLAVLVIGGTAGLYARLGAPGVPDQPYATRMPAGNAVADGDPMDMRRAAAQLTERLAADPTDAQAWLLLARTEAMLSEWDKASNAFHQAMQLGQSGPEVQAGYGEMLVMRAQGIVTPAARDAFTAALGSDPKNEVSRYYMALAAGQAGEPRKAIEQLQALAADLPADSGMRVELGKRVAEAARQAGITVPALADGAAPAAAGGPDDAAMAAAAQMPEADRQAMIAGMVAKLAARLAASPDDFEGWMRLGRAYAAMSERDKAVDAFDHAASLRTTDPAPKLSAIEVLLTGLRPSDPLPAHAVGLLHQVQLVAPDEPAVLWYLGIAAVRDGHKDEARGYWTRLLAKLPPNGNDAGMVKAALQTVQGS